MSDARTVPIITGTTDSVAEGWRLIRAVHPHADEGSVRVVEGGSTADGPRLAANLMISSAGIAAIVTSVTEGAVVGVKRAASTVQVHYAFYKDPQ